MREFGVNSGLIGGGGMSGGPERPTTMLLLHRQDQRLLAALRALAGAGVAVIGAPDEGTARHVLSAGGIAALLLTPRDGDFARACQAADAALGVIYLTARPAVAADAPPAPRAACLLLPFTEAELTASLAAVTRA